MKSLAEIKVIKSAMNATVVTMQQRLDKLDAEIARAKSDSSRSPEYIRETVQRLQHDALPFFGDKMREVQAAAKDVAIARGAWESKPYLLSMQRFSEIEQAEALIRLRWATEIARMPEPLIELLINDAMAAGNMPLLYQAYLVKPTAIKLDDVVIPDQAEALETIKACMAFPHQAELIAGQATAAGVSAARKLQLARQMQAA